MAAITGVITEYLLNYFWTKGVKPLIEQLEKVEENQSKALLLDATNVTTSYKEFELYDNWTNYQMIVFVIEMNYSSTTDVARYTESYLTSVLKNHRSSGIELQIYRQVAHSSYNYLAALSVKFVDNVDNVIELKKWATTYNGARRVRIYGIN